MSAPAAGLAGLSRVEGCGRCGAARALSLRVQQTKASRRRSLTDQDAAGRDRSRERRSTSAATAAAIPADMRILGLVCRHRPILAFTRGPDRRVLVRVPWRLQL